MQHPESSWQILLHHLLSNIISIFSFQQTKKDPFYRPVMTCPNDEGEYKKKKKKRPHFCTIVVQLPVFCLRPKCPCRRV